MFVINAPLQMFDWVIYWPPKTIKIFKLRLRWSKSSRMLRRLVFLAYTQAYRKIKLNCIETCKYETKLNCEKNVY